MNEFKSTDNGFELSGHACPDNCPYPEISDFNVVMHRQTMQEIFNIAQNNELYVIIECIRALAGLGAYEVAVKLSDATADKLSVELGYKLVPQGDNIYTINWK